MAVVAVLGACVRFLDPSQAANTDVGLQVFVQVTPTTMSVTDTLSRIRIRVSAKNPSLDTIRVDNGGPACDAQGDPLLGKGLEFSARVGDDQHPLDAGPQFDLCGTQLLVFPPRRTRTWDFYFTLKQWKNDGYPLNTQEYRVRSFFAGYEGYSALFTLVP